MRVTFTHKILLLLTCIICGFTSLSAQEIACSDGLDNDGDGFTDCFDSECADCNFDCEYRIPSSGSGNLELVVGNTGTDTAYTEVFLIIDSSGTILDLTYSVPPVFSNINQGRYLAAAISYANYAGITNLAINNNINSVTSACFEISESYAFEVCTNAPPVAGNIESSSQCFCAGSAVVSETITAVDADSDSITAVVRITSGYVSSEDSLAYIGAVAVSDSYDNATGTLTLGPAPPAIIEFALQNTSYFNKSGFGSETAGIRTVSISLNDNWDSSNTVSRNVLVGDAVTCPCINIGSAKAVTDITPAATGTNGNSDVTYRFIIQNTGSLDIGNISLIENLQTQFGNAFVSVTGQPTITSGTASVNPTLAAGYNGNSNDDFFTGTDGLLKPGESITVSLTVEIDNSEIITVPLENQGTVQGTAKDSGGNNITDGLGNPVTYSDLSDSGTNPTTDNGSGGSDDPTPFLSPAIGLTKAVLSSVPSPTLNNVYVVDFEFIVENTGSTVLEDISISDDLSGWGAALLTSSAPTISVSNINATTLPIANNGSYNGTGDTNLLDTGSSSILNPGESFIINLTVHVDITQAPSGLQNTATVSANPTDGNGGAVAGFPSVNDISDDATGLPQGEPTGSNPGATGDTGTDNDPTIITFPPVPVLAKAIISNPTALPNRNYEVAYLFTVKNNGSSPLCNIDLVENLEDNLGCAFVRVLNTGTISLTNISGNSLAPTPNLGYNGASQPNLFNSNGCLAPGDYLTVTANVEIDIACAGVSQPLANSATLSGVDLTDNTTVSDISDDETDLNNDTVYDNDTGGSLDPTLLSIPRIDLAKELISSVVLSNGNIETTFSFTMRNTGNASLSGLALEDDLATQHGAAFVRASVLSISGNATTLGNANLAFSGAGILSSSFPDGNDLLDRSSVLEPGQIIVVVLKEELNPILIPPTGLLNQGLATATAPDGTEVSDLSDNGSDPSADTDAPTPLELGAKPELKKSLTTAPTPAGGTDYELIFDFELKNNGSSEMCFIDVLENLSTNFGCAFKNSSIVSGLVLANLSGNSLAPTPNPNFNGSSQTNLFESDGCLFPGDQLTWSITVIVDSDCSNSITPLANTAIVEAQNNSGGIVTDRSDDNTDLDNNGTLDNNTGSSNDPTIIYLPEIAVTKALMGSTALSNGNLALDFRFNIENIGNSDLSNLTISDDLTALQSALIGISSLTVQNISASSVPADNSADYTGTGITNMTLGSASDLLKPGQSFIVFLTIEIDPQAFGLLPQPIENQSIASGNPITFTGNTVPGYSPVSDLSDDGTGLVDGGEPNSSNPGAGNDNGLNGKDDVTIVTLLPTPQLTKTQVGQPIKLANGNFEVTYEFKIQNLGGSQFCNIDLNEDLASQFDCGFAGLINLSDPILTNTSGLSIAPSRNNAFNGRTNINVLASNGCLFAGDEITQTLTVEVNINCPTVPAPMSNQAEIIAESPSGISVTDLSDDATDIDNDSTPDNETGGEDDPSLLLIPNIALTEAITDVSQLPNGLYQIDFLFNIENIGNTSLTNLSLKDTLDFAAALTGATPIVSIINIDAANPPAANTGLYNGTTVTELLNGSTLDQLNPGEAFFVKMTVQIEPDIFLSLSQPTENQSFVTGTPIDYDNTALIGFSNASDDSDDATGLPNAGDPTGSNPGAVNDSGIGATNDPTIIDLPKINLAKRLSNVQPSLNHGNFYLTFDLVLKNSGTSPLEDIQVTDYLNTLFGSAYQGLTAGPIVSVGSGNPILPTPGAFPGQVFDGNSGYMSPGDEILISFTTEIDPDAGGAPTPLENQATATASSSITGIKITDLSDDGTDPDSDNGDGNNDTPTPINLPRINIAKEFTGINPASSGTAGHFDVTYRFYIENTGNQSLDHLSLIEDLDNQMGAGFVQIVNTPTIYQPLTTSTGGPIINPNFTGSAPNTDIFIGTAADVLEPNQTIVIDLTVEINPMASGISNPIENQAIISANSPDGTTVTDNSDNGTDPKTDNNDGGYDDPTPIDCPDAGIELTALNTPICTGSGEAEVSLMSNVVNATYEWINTANPSAILSTEQNPTFKNLNFANTFEVRISPAQGCYSNLTAQILIDVTQGPAAPVLGAVKVCEGDVLQLMTSASADNYSWTGPNNFQSNDQNPFVTNSADLSVGGDYELRIEENGCWSLPGTLTILIIEAPEQPSISAASPVCAGEELVLSTNAVFDTYQWLSPAGASSNPLLNTTVPTTGIPFGDADYLAGNWRLVGTNAQGCTSEASEPAMITISSIPVTPAPLSDAPVCSGSEFQLFAGGTYPADAIYQWYDVNPTIAGATPFTNEKDPIVKNISAVGFYTYYLTVTVNGCDSEHGNVNVVINPAMDVTASNSGAACVNANTDIVLTAAASGGQLPFTYSWIGPNGFTSNSISPTLANGTNSPAGIYSVTVTDATGCFAVAETTVSTSSQPVKPQLTTGADELCINSKFVIEAQIFNGFNVNYEWVGPRGSTSAGDYADSHILTINDVTAADEGDYTLQVTVDGCTSSVSAPITLTIVPQIGKPNVTNITVCEGEPLQLETTTIADEYFWTGSSGFAASGQSPYVAAEAAPIHNGNYKLYVQNGNCISETAEFTITVNSRGDLPTLQTNSPVCEGESLTFETSSQFDEYRWIGPDGNSPHTMSNPLLVTNTGNTTIPVGDDAYDAGNWYLIGITADGCESAPSEIQEVIINPIPETPIPSNSGTVCERASFQLFAGGTYPVGTEYSWYSIAPNNPFATVISIEKDPIIDDKYVAGFYEFYLIVTVNGCDSEYGITTVTVEPTPTATPDNGGIACAGSNDDLVLTANPAGGTPPYKFTWKGPNSFESNVENPVIPYAGNDISGTYTVIITDDNGCSSLPAATVVRVGNTPAPPTITAGDQELCEGEELIISGPAYQGGIVEYHWILPGGSVQNTTVSSLIISSVDSATHHGAYYLEVSVDGCRSVASPAIFVNIYKKPDLPVVPNDMMVCEGATATFSTSTVANSYLWEGPDGYLSRKQSPPAIPDFQSIHAGKYTLEVENFNCKSDRANFNIGMENRPATPILNTETSLCDGDTLRLRTADLATGYSYQWIAPGATASGDFGDPNDPNNPAWTTGNSSIITSTDNPDLYQGGEWSVRVLNPNGCKSEISVPIDITINPVPVTPPALANGPICEGEDVILTTAVLPGLSYNWYEGDPNDSGVLISNAPNTVLVNQSGGVHDYYLTVEMNGCPAHDSTMRTVSVDIREMPNLDSVGNTGPYCEGDTIQLAAQTIPGAVYEWTGPGFTSSSEDPEIYNASVHHEGMYSLKVRNGTCVSDPISMQVLVTAQPTTPVVENNGPGCEGGFVQLSTPSVPSGGFVIYEWTGPNNFTSGVQNPKLGAVDATDAGEYFLTVSVNGCPSLSSAATIVDINPVPAAPVAENNTTQLAPACDGTTVQLETPFIPGASYQWIGPGGFTSDLSNPMIENATQNNTGLYQVIVTVAGCSSVADTTPVFVNEPIEVPIAVGKGPYCEGDDMSLSVANYNPAFNYTWYDSTGNFVVFNGPALNINNITANQAGTYYVVAELNGCESNPTDLAPSGEDAFFQVIVDVHSRERAFIDEDMISVCADTVTLSAQPIFDNAGTGSWSLSDPDNLSVITAPDESSTFIANLQQGENEFIWAIYSGACGMTSADTATVTVLEGPEAEGDAYAISYGAVLDSTIIENDNPNAVEYIVELITEPQHGFVQLNTDGTFIYHPNEGFVGADFFEYQLCNTSCLDQCVTARAIIETGLKDECIVPDVFTPNNDGTNETFVIPCLQLYEGNEIAIFNRWGDEVYKSNDYQNNWDGSFKGSDLPVGTYFYILKINDPEQTVRKGYIFLQR